MKIKDGFMLRQVGSQTVVVAVGQASRDFNGIIRLNSVGEFLWKSLETDLNEDELLERVLSTYEIDETTARADIKDFVEKLKEADLLV